MPIFADNFINQLAADGLDQINIDVQAVWQRCYIPITQGQSVYTLPSFVRSITAITYRGYHLSAENWEELTLLSPTTVFLSPGNQKNVETSQSRPLYYGMHPTNPYDIRLYPCPGENLGTTGGNVYGPQPNEPFCTISYYRSTDSTGVDLTAQLPPYIVRRTQKAYVLWKAFAAEGKGQNLNASKYYKSKYDFLVNRFREINAGCYVGKKYMIDDAGLLTSDGNHQPKPLLPPNFERIIYR